MRIHYHLSAGAAVLLALTSMGKAHEVPPEVAAQLISKYDLIALPVVNNEGKMLGIITHDDAMDIAAEEASIKILYQKRVFWLVLLVFGNIFSGAGIA